MTYDLRSYREGDEAALFELNRRCFISDWGEQWSDGDLSSALSMPGVHALLATYCAAADTETICGFLLSRVVEDEAEILLIGVDPDFRRARIASALMQRFMTVSSQMGVLKVFLEVREGNLSAMKLYRKIGLTQVGTRQDYYKNKTGETAHAFTLRIHLKREMA